MNIGESFQNLLNDVIRFIPQALAFLAILVVGWLLARWIGKLIGKALSKLKLDVAAEKSGLRRFTGKYEVSQLLGMLVYFALFLVVLQLAFGVFGSNAVSDLLNQFVAWLPMLFVAIVITVVAFAVANAVYGLVSGTLSHTSYGNTVARVVQSVIIVVGVFAALGQAGIALAVTMPLLWTGLAIIAGVAIVGIGGGLIKPMQDRWENMLHTAEQAVKEENGNAMAASSTEQMGQSYQSPRYSSEADIQGMETPVRAEESQLPPEDR